MAHVGRNDLCPCGSGKKYKRCHLPLEEQAPPSPAQVAESTHGLDRRLVENLLQFASRRFPRWNPVDEYEVELGGDAEQDQLFAPFVVYHCLVDGKPVVQWFRDERGPKLSEDERDWLAAQQRGWLSVWEVTAVTPGESIWLKDALSSEDRLVIEKTGSRLMRPRDAILARVVDYRGASLLCGVHGRALPPREADALVRAMKRELRVRTKPVAVDRLRDPEIVRLLISRWCETSNALDQRPLPGLRNTDGEELLLCVDHFAVLPGKRSEIAARLAALPGAESADEGDRFEVTFTRAGNPMHQNWENTIVGCAGLSEECLEIETNSRTRADALRVLIDSACEGLIRHRVREQTDPVAALAKDPRRPPKSEAARHADEQTIIREFKQKHYADWIAQPVPALKGATPMEAVHKPAGRREVELLLKEIEHNESRLPAAERFDVSALREKLGLTSPALPR